MKRLKLCPLWLCCISLCLLFSGCTGETASLEETAAPEVSLAGEHEPGKDSITGLDIDISQVSYVVYSHGFSTPVTLTCQEYGEVIEAALTAAAGEWTYFDTVDWSQIVPGVPANLELYDEAGALLATLSISGDFLMLGQGEKVWERYTSASDYSFYRLVEAVYGTLLETPGETVLTGLDEAFTGEEEWDISELSYVVYSSDEGSVTLDYPAYQQVIDPVLSALEGTWTYCDTVADEPARLYLYDENGLSLCRLHIDGTYLIASDGRTCHRYTSDDGYTFSEFESYVQAFFQDV